MEVQPNASQSISRGFDSSPWKILDTFALGNHTVNLTAPIPLSQAVTRIEALTEQQPGDPAMPFLAISVNGTRVVAQYIVSGAMSRSWSSSDGLGVLAAVRPIFRGDVSGDNQAVQLRGWFGVNTFTRLLGFASVVLAVALAVGGLLHVPLGIGAAAWIVPVAFIVMCLLTRANGDDIGYIEKNLKYAFYRDSGSQPDS